MITITKVEKKEPLFHKLLKKLFDFKKNIFIKDLEFSLGSAVLKGGCFRKCGTIWSPSASAPYNEDNWHSKICAIVFVGVKIISFTAVNKA